jgi:hypothetical protein
MTEEDIRQQSYNDELIKLRLSNISLNARPKVERRAPVKQIVTQQQIDDYRSKLNKPVIVGGKKYKYSKPGEVPDLEEINEDILDIALTNEQIGNTRLNIKTLTEEYNANIKKIVELEQQKKDFLYRINNEPDYIEFLGKIDELKQQKKDIEKEIINKEKLLNRIIIDDRIPVKVKKEKIEKEKNDINKLDIKLNEIVKQIEEGEAGKLNVGDYINDNIRKVEDQIDKIKEENEEKQKNTMILQQRLNNNEQQKSINQAEEQRVKEINKGRVKNYQEQLNQLNSGAFSIIQQENETEEEWLERLNQMGDTIFDDDRINLESNLYNVKELRKNLKEIIKDDVIIDDVIRAFNVVEEDVYQLNTIFNPYIKNKFIKLYGKFNPRITFDNVYNLLSEILYQGKHGMKKDNDGTDEKDDDVEVKKTNLDKSTDVDDLDQSKNTSSSVGEEPQLGFRVGSMLNTAATMFTDKLTGKLPALEYYPSGSDYETQGEKKYDEEDGEDKEDEEDKEKFTDIDLYNESDFKIGAYKNSFMIYNKKNDKVLYLRVASNQQSILIAYDNEGKGVIKDSVDAIGRYRLYGGREGIPFNGESFIPWLSKKTGVYSVKTDERKGIENNVELIKEYLGGSGTLTKITKYLKEKYGMTSTQQQIVRDSSGKNIKKNDGTDLMGYGLGLPKDIPKELIPFGRCKLHLYKLYYDNEFVLKDSSGFNIPGLRNVKVSDDFVELIMKIHNKENISQSFIKKLSKAEQDLYDLVIFKCGLKNIDIDHKTNVKNLKEKLATIEGEIEAGNDNKEVLKELYDVLQQLVIYKSINVSEAKKHYNSIKNDFF